MSWEVDPEIAFDRERTYEEAKRLHEWIDEPNLYVKIPATAAGVGAIEDSVADGRDINVTLIFSLQRHDKVMKAYVRGLERFAESGGDVSKVHSVASFFVSRVDTEADKRLDAIGRTRSAGQARGREREARVPELQARVLGPALGGARREGRASAALPLGVDVDEEPGLPRRALRRGADRARHGEHDARGDDRGVPGSRRRRRHARAGRSRRPSRCSSTCARPASTTTT